MTRRSESPETWRARQARVARGKAIRSGAVPGLFESDGKRLKPEVRRMIDAAIARRIDSGQAASDRGDDAIGEA
jgi:hypothetical protein